jgi:hypothetical protein
MADLSISAIKSRVETTLQSGRWFDNEEECARHDVSPKEAVDIRFDLQLACRYAEQLIKEVTMGSTCFSARTLRHAKEVFRQFYAIAAEVSRMIEELRRTNGWIRRRLRKLQKLQKSKIMELTDTLYWMMVRKISEVIPLIMNRDREIAGRRLEYPIGRGGFNPCAPIPGSELYFRKPTVIRTGGGVRSEGDDEDVSGMQLVRYRGPIL